jgi:hypothetical protein
MPALNFRGKSIVSWALTTDVARSARRLIKNANVLLIYSSYGSAGSINIVNGIFRIKGGINYIMINCITAFFGNKVRTVGVPESYCIGNPVDPYDERTAIC